MALRRRHGAIPVALLLLSCGFCFVPTPGSLRPRDAATTASAAIVSFFAPAAAFAQDQQMDAATMVPELPGEYQGDGPWYVFAVVGSGFFAFTAWQAWNDQFGLNDEVATTSDDYFNPDFDPYKGMNLKKDPKTGQRPR